MATALKEETPRTPETQQSEAVVVRFAGDSGDGMQLTGGQFTLSTALAGNDLATFPDFPAEIRAPQGTLFGVSAFQINFGSTAIETAGDQPDVLVAMNPAALKVNVPSLKTGGLIIADSGEFSQRNLDKAKYDSNPLEDGSLAEYKLLAFDISALTLESVKPFGLGNKEALRCKNMWTLGLALWMFDRDRQPLIDWLNKKFATKPDIAEANIAALNAGHAYGETAELSGPLKQHHVDAAPSEPGLYRTVDGAEAVALGLVAGAQLAGVPMFFGGYPITPASDILHYLAPQKHLGVRTFQAEDEIAAVCAAIGVSFAGQLGVTGTSGPGLALKAEANNATISLYTDLPAGLTDKALALSVDLGLLAENGGVFSPASTLCKLLRTPHESERAAVLRVTIESFTPFQVFREELEATADASAAATRTKARLDIDCHREEIKDTLVSLATFIGALTVSHGNSYERDNKSIGNLLAELAAGSGEEAAAVYRIREEIGPSAAAVCDHDEVISPLAAGARHASGGGAGREAVVNAGNAIESFLNWYGNQRGHSVAGSHGLNAKIESLRQAGHIPPKLVNASKYLGHIRNAADHGVDADIGAPWNISEATGRNYIFVAAQFIRSVVDFNAGHFEI